MASPSVAPASSAGTETVIRKRNLTAAEASKGSPGERTPDFWDYIESLTPEQWQDHTIYLYREDPKSSTYAAGPAYLDKFIGYIEIRPGVQVPMEERGMIEAAIKEKFGGKAFRLICKKGRERITEGKCSNEAPPKYPDANQGMFAGPLPNAPAASDPNMIAAKAIDTVAGQQPEAINIAMNVLKTASELVMKAGAATPTPTQESELDRAFRQAMIQRLLAPQPDPVESFLRIRAALGSTESGGAGNPLVDKLLNAAVDRFMNPAAPAVSGRTTLLDLGREFIPVLGTTVRETMHEYRMAREADVRLAELSRGVPGGMPPQPAAQVPAPAIDVTESPVAAPGPEPAQNPPPAAAPGGAPSFQWIAECVARIVKNMDYTVDQAVDEVLSFLYNADARLVGLLIDPPKLDARLAPGKQGLLQLFQYEPALASCLAVNAPRVSEFIDKFLIAGKEAEDAEARLRAAAPATAPAPKPA